MRKQSIWLAAVAGAAALLWAHNSVGQNLQAPLPNVVIQEKGETFTFAEDGGPPDKTPGGKADPTQPVKSQPVDISAVPATEAKKGKFQFSGDSASLSADETVKEDTKTVQENPIAENTPQPNRVQPAATPKGNTPALEFVEEATTAHPTATEAPKVTEPIKIVKEPEIIEAPSAPTPNTKKISGKPGEPEMTVVTKPKSGFDLLDVVTPSKPEPAAIVPPATAGADPLALPDITGANTNVQTKKPNQRPSLEDLASDPKENSEKLTQEDADALIKYMFQEGQKKDGARARRISNLRQEEMNFENVPLGKMLRLLAEQAGFNFIEPALGNADEVISFRFQNMTPLEAFMQICKARGFSVITHHGVTTLRRADIANPEFMIVKKYNLKHAQPKWVIQQVANLLGIEIKTPQDVIQSYPKPSEEALTYGGQNSNNGGGSSGSSGSSGTSGVGSQNIGLPTSPRWTASLPFDEPSYAAKGKQGSDAFIFIDRASRALVIQASAGDHDMVKEYIDSMDVAEPQVMIEVKVVEIKNNNDLQYGTDWSKMLGDGLKVKMEGSKSFDWGSIVFGAAAGTPGQLTLSVSNAEITINALEKYGNGTVTNMPKTMTRSGVPVSISSTITEATPAYQMSTAAGGTGTVSTPSNYNTFTTGMTIDLVPQLQAGSMVDINMNPTVSNKIGETYIPQAGSTPAQRIPIISSRAITTSASVPSGMTIMVGGLTAVTDTNSTMGIPLLSHLPLLGKTVFGNTSKGKSRQTLIIFVTPTIVWPDEYQKVYTNDTEWEAMKKANRADFDQENTPLPNAHIIRRARPVPETMLPAPQANARQTKTKKN